MLKTLPLIILAASLGPSLAMVLSPQPRIGVPDEAGPQQAAQIAVDAQSQITIVPDLARFSVFVEEPAATRTAALAAVDARLQKVLAVLPGHGIGGGDAQTQAPDLTPTFPLDARGRPRQNAEPIAWTARRTIALCSHRLEALGALQRDIYAAGAYPAGDIVFDTSKLQELQNQARESAARAARKKAEALVRELGGQLGPPLVIQETNASYSGPWTYKNSLQELASPAVVDASFAAGKMSVSGAVQVTFALEPG